ncbi:DUF1206 domain-containing protein [Caulobacter sp. NIBR2454]|uniref:DUF1206 domain-containing protein n=1 Tax=Caulobacter sp. NIBR2454 TaxID=3015996 RepID=UPI0022B61780|nr:DUF1206 domain-containing protein [Caulobacter sp. NIBR2454]
MGASTAIRRIRKAFGVYTPIACRLGYIARGLVYLSVGVLGVMAALDLTPRAAGTKGAIEAWAKWPAGYAMIAAIAAGLWAFAGWRALQAVFDADDQGSSPKAIASRIGQAISGVVYGGLGLFAFELLDELEDFGEADEEQAAEAMAFELIRLPYGEWLLGAVALFILGVAAGNLIQAFAKDFSAKLGCHRTMKGWALILGRLGYGARGVAFLPMGFFMMRAAFAFRASEAVSLGGALQAIERQPFGSLGLAVTGLGLMAFGGLALIEARYRRIKVD